MKDWRDYPGRSQSVAVLERWAKGLKYFRYCPAHRGHAGGGDRFLAKVFYSEKEDLEATMKKLGLSLSKASREDPNPIHEYPKYEQPCHQDINGIKTFIWVKRNEFTISIAGADGDIYSVTDQDFLNAQRVEEMLDLIKNNIVIPPIDDPWCISEKYYPELWQ